jgi:putative endonuclease
MHYVYIVQSQIKNWKYIGVTEDLEKRLLLHNSGATKSTKPYRPLKLIYTEEFTSKTEALRRELFLKKNFKAREAIYKSLELNDTALSSNG